MVRFFLFTLGCFRLADRSFQTDIIIGLQRDYIPDAGEFRHDRERIQRRLGFQQAVFEAD
jgi:hypothetical protein